MTGYIKNVDLRTLVIMIKVLLLAGILAFASGAPSAKKLLETSRSATLRRAGGRIVGGEDATYGEFPHQIELQVFGALMCGGSLVADKWVVTAGHCCDGAFADILRVLVGSHHRTEIDEDQDSIPVNSLILHENYDSYTVENDICLLELGEKVIMGEHVGIIALPDPMEEYEAGTMCTVTGWGALSEGGSLGDTLQKVDVPVVSDEDCRAAYGQADVADSMICAGFDQGGKDSCQGDSGGPFMCGAQLSGIVSWGYGCAQAGYPGVYTQTSYFIDWLNTNMA